MQPIWKTSLKQWLPATIWASADEVQRAVDRKAGLVDAAKVRIEAELDDITVGRLSRASDLSRSEFSRMFRRAEGVPPRTYVLGRRIERARTLLRSDQPLSELALELGFCDQAHFTRVFKRITGETPAAYRRRTNVQDGTEPL